MSDLLDMIRALNKTEGRIGQTEVKERPGARVTYTPTYSGATSTGVTTYTAQVGSYMQIGPLVIVGGYVGWSAATGTGQAVIGLPLNVANITNLFLPVALWYAGVTYGGTGVIGLIRPNTARLELWTPASNAASAAVNVGAAGEVSFMCAYWIR